MPIPRYTATTCASAAPTSSTIPVSSPVQYSAGDGPGQAWIAGTYGHGPRRKGPFTYVR